MPHDHSMAYGHSYIALRAATPQEKERARKASDGRRALRASIHLTPKRRKRWFLSQHNQTGALALCSLCEKETLATQTEELP